MLRKVALIASASGNGKTTLGRELTRQLDVPFLELDALFRGPGWAETPDDELRAKVEPIVGSDGWVIDSTYQRKLGDLVLQAADVVVWLDLPIRVWLPRLIGHTLGRIRTREPLWNDNRESLRGALRGTRVAAHLGVPLALPPPSRLADHTRALPRPPTQNTQRRREVPRPNQRPRT